MSILMPIFLPHMLDDNDKMVHRREVPGFAELLKG